MGRHTSILHHCSAKANFPFSYVEGNYLELECAGEKEEEHKRDRDE
jgi:hypothetical protein